MDCNELNNFIGKRTDMLFENEAILERLKALLALRKERTEEKILNHWLKEFKNLGWNSRLVISKIESLKYKEGRIRFCDFINEDDYSMINYELVKLEASRLLELYLRKQ